MGTIIDTRKSAAARQNREQALVFALLSFCIVLALAFSNFGRDPSNETVRDAIKFHRELLLRNQLVLAANRRELERDLEALSSTESAGRKNAN